MSVTGGIPTVRGPVGADAVDWFPPPHAASIPAAGMIAANAIIRARRRPGARSGVPVPFAGLDMAASFAGGSDPDRNGERWERFVIADRRCRPGPARRARAPPGPRARPEPAAGS